VVRSQPRGKIFVETEESLSVLRVYLAATHLRCQRLAQSYMCRWRSLSICRR
jgi:hypothetical protein